MVRRRGQPSPRPAWAPQGPSLLATLYLLLFLHGFTFTEAVFEGRPAGYLWLSGLGLALAGAATAAGLLRPLIIDTIATFRPLGRLIIRLLPLAGFLPTALIDGLSARHEGFAFALPLLLLLAVDARQVRLYLAASILGFWFVCGRPEGLHPGRFALFGLTTLTSLTLTHWAFMGEPFGLRGWWALRRVLATALTYALPAGLLAGGMYLAWPERRPSAASAEPLPTGAVGLPARRLSRGEIDQISESIGRLTLFLLLMLASLVFITLLRRWLGRKGRAVAVPVLRGADLSEVEPARTQPAPPRPKLAGNRGKIVHLWWKWVRASEAHGSPPWQPPETAADWARRLGPIGAGLTQWDEMTQLVEEAHYGPVEPSAADVARMARLVDDELDRLNQG